MMVTNCKFGPATSAVASFLVEGPDGPVVTRSLLQNLPLDVRGSHEGGTLSFARNRIRCPGYYATMIFYYSLVAPPLGTGQVVQNSFDGTKCIDVIQQNNTGIQLGNNHWAGSANNPPVPEVIYNSATTNIYFAPVLSVAPDPCGPTW